MGPWHDASGFVASGSSRYYYYGSVPIPTGTISEAGSVAASNNHHHHHHNNKALLSSQYRASAGGGTATTTTRMNGRSGFPAAMVATILTGLILLLRFLTGNDPLAVSLLDGWRNHDHDHHDVDHHRPHRIAGLGASPFFRASSDRPNPGENDGDV